MAPHTTNEVVLDLQELGDVGGRRHFLSRLAVVAGAAALAPMILDGHGISSMLHAQSASGQTEPNLTDTNILNYALTLEYLEATFYLRADSGGALPTGATIANIDPDGAASPGTVPGLSSFTAPAPATFNVPTFVRTVRDHELIHVVALRSALGASALNRTAFRFNFGSAFSSTRAFLETALVLEDTGVTAYLGQAGNLDVVTTLGTAGSILGVEAEHAAAFRVLLGLPVTVDDGAYDTARTTTQVLAAAGPFITAAPALPFP